MDKTVRLLDFNIYDEVVEKDTSSESDNSSGEYKYKQEQKYRASTLARRPFRMRTSRVLDTFVHEMKCLREALQEEHR